MRRPCPTRRSSDLPGGSAVRGETVTARTGGGYDRLDARRKQGLKRGGSVGADKDAPDGLRCREAVEHARQHRPAGDIGEELVADPAHRRHRVVRRAAASEDQSGNARRSEEHTSELQSLMRISYAVFCLKKKKTKLTTPQRHDTT